MEPADLPGEDPNALPYFIIEAQTNRRVPVCFEPLTAADMPELSNEDWAQAVFAPVWRQLTGVERVFKVLRADEQDKRIQGLVRPGALDPSNTFLVNSLLESAPFNRSGAAQQEYRGTGRALVARLIVESVMSGGSGRVIVRPRTGTEAFYKAIGFTASSPTSHRYLLRAESAAQLVRAVCRSENQRDE